MSLPYLKEDSRVLADRLTVGVLRLLNGRQCIDDERQVTGVSSFLYSDGAALCKI
jgi:hypothetical protein